MKNILYLLCFTFLFLNYSCSEQIEIEQTEYELSVSYFLDGDLIDENTYLDLYETHHNVWMLNEIDEQNNPIYKNYCFSSDEKYFTWGETYDLNLKARLEAVEYLRNQAIDLGWVDKYKSLEEIPKEILDRQTRYLQEMDLIPEGSQQRTINQLRDFCFSTFPSTYMINFMGVMPSGWNNRVSSIMPTGYSFMTIYDRTFFRTAIGQIFLGPYVESCWAPGAYPNVLNQLHNRMSSVTAL